MVKRVLSLIIGFGMITVGVAGIATTVIDRRNEAALEQIEKLQEKTQVAATEEQRKIEEKQQEIEELSRSLQEEKRHLVEERRKADRARRAAEAAIQQKSRLAKASPPAPEKDKVRSKETETPRKSPLVSHAPQKSEKKSTLVTDPGHSVTSRAPGQSREDAEAEAIKKISRKAGMEAARLSEPVQYYNKRTDELILAEPFDFGYDSVRVRIRVWRNDRLVKDKVVSFSQASLGMWGSPRG